MHVLLYCGHMPHYALLVWANDQEKCKNLNLECTGNMWCNGLCMDLWPRLRISTKKRMFNEKYSLIKLCWGVSLIVTIYSSGGQTVKGGISETRIEKRIVITGDADIDHDEVSWSFSLLMLFLIYSSLSSSSFFFACEVNNWIWAVTMKTSKLLPLRTLTMWLKCGLACDIFPQKNFDLNNYKKCNK